MSFTISTATSADLEGITDLWYSAFPKIVTITPHTPACRNWVSSSISKYLAQSTPAQSCVVLVIKDPETQKIVAFARYFILGADWSNDWKVRWEGNLAEGMAEEKIGDAFLDPMARQHRVVTGEKRHLFLEILATDENYRGKGLGSQLLKKTCEVADEEGLDCYLDASKMGLSLYQKFGYVEQDCRDEKAISAPMLRAAKK